MTDQQQHPQFAPAPSVESLLGSGLSGRVPFPTPDPTPDPALGQALGQTLGPTPGPARQAEPTAAVPPAVPSAAPAAEDAAAEHAEPVQPVQPVQAVEPIVTDLGVATDHEVPFLQMTVEAVAASLITKLHAAEAAAREHLAAMEAEAARRCELLTAQAELDAELIRLYARRESHAILAAARATIAPEASTPAADAEAGLEAVGEAVLRGVEALDAHLQRLHTFHSGSTDLPGTEAPA